jgi:hypothetical protein
MQDVRSILTQNRFLKASGNFSTNVPPSQSRASHLNFEIWIRDDGWSRSSWIHRIKVND